MAVTINGSTGITTPGITNSGNETVSGNSAVTGNFSVGGSNISPVQSFRNKIINGNFDIWQRGTTGTSDYVADRWRTGLSGSTANVSRQAFTVGQTDVPNNPKYFSRTVVTSVAGSSNFCRLDQRIESVSTLANQVVTASFYAKSDASRNIAFEIFQHFGDGGSPSSSVTAIGVTTCALTTDWQKFTITATIPSISGKTLGTADNDYINLLFWFDAGSNINSRTNSLGQQSGTFDIAQVQLEAGSVATPFEVRPPGVELALCQRYYQRIGDSSAIIFAVYATSGSAGYQTYTLLQEMRSFPTATKVGTFTVSNGGQPSISPTNKMFRITQVVTSTGAALSTAGSGLYITFDAEL